MSWIEVLFLIVLTGLVLWSAFGLGTIYQRRVDVRIIYKALEDGFLNEADAEAAALFIRHGRE